MGALDALVDASAGKRGRLSCDPVDCIDIPVSYTHLDVYKRQVSSRAIAASDIRFRIVPIPHLAALAASCVLAFCPTPAGAAITAAGMALTLSLIHI